MFVDELPLVEQAMVDYGNVIEKSPIVHPEIAGRGVEYSHGRAAFFYSSRCNGVLGEMEDLVCRAHDKHNPKSWLLNLNGGPTTTSAVIGWVCCAKTWRR